MDIWIKLDQTKLLRVTVVNRAFPSLHKGVIKITLTVPLKLKKCQIDLTFLICSVINFFTLIVSNILNQIISDLWIHKIILNKKMCNQSLLIFDYWTLYRNLYSSFDCWLLCTNLYSSFDCWLLYTNVNSIFDCWLLYTNSILN